MDNADGNSSSQTDPQPANDNGGNLSTEDIIDEILSVTATHYQVLGVNKDATTAEIRSAYKKRALRIHPDKYQGPRKAEAETCFKKLATAVETLSDESSRRNYDRDISSAGLSSQSSNESSSSMPMPEFSRPDQQYYSAYIFLSQVRSELEENPDADMTEAFPLILLGTLHVFVEFVAFLASRSPLLLVTLGLMGFVASIFVSEETAKAWIESVRWEALHPRVRLMLLDVLLAFYKKKMLEARMYGDRPYHNTKTRSSRAHV